MNKEDLWTGLSLIPALEARVTGAPVAHVCGVSIDTRTLEPGDLFVAIKGENSDGHDYVRAAFERGAAAAVVDEAHADELKQAGPLFIVRSVLPALERLGVAARARSSAGIVAVTGSVGKTGTKEMLRLALSSAGACHASAASYNNHWGVPLTLSRMPAQAKFGVFEIGMSHTGEITPLTRMVRPHVAIITTIAPVHLEHFTSVDEIADAKGEIFLGLEPHGVAIVHRDVPQFDRLRMHAKSAKAETVLSFGADPAADARLISVTENDGGSTVEAWVLGDTIRYKLGAPGRHLAMNSLAVLLGARALGVEPGEAAAALAGFSAPAGRGARRALKTQGEDIILIDESYNANPTSMRAALQLLGSAQTTGAGRRIAVIGDMLELGPAAVDLHREIADSAVENNVDLVFAAGPLSKAMFDSLPAALRGAWASSSKDVVPSLLEDVRSGDVIMVKGSNGSRMNVAVKALEEKFGAGGGETAKG